MMTVTMTRNTMIALGVLLMLALMGVAASVLRPSVPDQGTLDLRKKSGQLALDSNRTPKENFPRVEILGDTKNYTGVFDTAYSGDQTTTVLAITLDVLDHLGISQNGSGGQASPSLHNIVSVTLNSTGYRTLETEPETTPTESDGGESEAETTQKDVAQETEDDDSSTKKTLVAVLVPVGILILVVAICVVVRVTRARRDEGYEPTSRQDATDMMMMNAVVGGRYM